ncbi:hypothetical protein C4K68_26300 [Pokkaliibacter plantistimulans]|uniref:Helix-turn-helix domain-containing protein n=1 Tax=Proteobacteria bacterium 228 TaxID=2083153 RepID=A0A2S5KI00_9PROT|nr:winged helix-turn-helix domain-containing protein [Pokkaliibacter plantistimulans]PPC74447.1 hypothetical protein C4K68_26300 [Pokkaliibacter plantistimulans]
MVSKQQKAFYRKLYLSWLVAQQEHSLTSLVVLTAMPRRTIQDTLADLSDIGIDCQFVQREGGRHNEGYYQLCSWGPINPTWVEEHLPELLQALAPSDAQQ